MSTFSVISDPLVPSLGAAPSWRPAKGERVVVYGAGGFAHAAIAAIREAGGIVEHVLDRRGGQSARVPGAQVHVPGAEPLSPTERAATPVVIGVYNRDADPNEIVATLRALGYERIVGVPELYESFADTLGSRYWLAPRAVYASATDRINEAAELWADDASRQLYASLLRFRTAWPDSVAPGCASGMQYFPNDVPRTTVPLRFVDCGAFVGDTLESLAACHASVEQAYAFEPDLGNFARLAECARDMGAKTGARVALWPCAVGERAGSMRFSAEGGEAGHLSAEGDRAVTVVALDEALPTEYVTDLKMDIEGAELDALRGAERLVRRCHPRLAICVYHRAEHLWEIPLFVRDMGLGYDYFLRSHGHFGFDVVMYAVPRVGG
jgi:FkbM family methyltransferase